VDDEQQPWMAAGRDDYGFLRLDFSPPFSAPAGPGGRPVGAGAGGGDGPEAGKVMPGGGRDGAAGELTVSFIRSRTGTVSDRVRLVSRLATAAGEAVATAARVVAPIAGAGGSRSAGGSANAANSDSVCNAWRAGALGRAQAVLGQDGPKV
jgi:hypothetical protein